MGVIAIGGGSPLVAGKAARAHMRHLDSAFSASLAAVKGPAGEAAFGCGEQLSGYSGCGVQDRLPDKRLDHFHLEPVAGERLRVADRQAGDLLRQGFARRLTLQ